MMTSFVSSATNACLINRFSREKIALCQTKEDIEVLKKMGDLLMPCATHGLAK